MGQATTLAKLNGRVYTPPDVARGMVELLRWPGHARARLLDPACGEGVFLEQALIRLVRERGASAATARWVESNMWGWELNPEALATARERLTALSRTLGLGGVIPSLLHVDALDAKAGSFECILGNPPYLEAKRMPTSLKERVRSRCPLAARGAFDLYAAFVEMGLEQLAMGGELCFIVPNRILVTSAVEGLREEMLRVADVQVIDLSRERVFKDAAVYPVIVHATLKGDADARAQAVGADLSTSLRDRFGSLLTLEPPDVLGRGIIAKMSRAEHPRLADVAEARWCVSFHRSGLREQFTFDHRPDVPTERARPFIGGGRFSGNREVEPFRLNWAGWWIDYDRRRAGASGNALPPLEIFDPPKIAVCQNARRARAAMDRTGAVFKDTFILIRPRPSEPARPGLLEWLTVLLNTDLYHYYYEHIYAGTRKGGGFLHFLPRYLEPLPVPPMPDPELLLALHAALEAGEDLRPTAERLVQDRFGINREEREYLEEYPLPEF